MKISIVISTYNSEEWLHKVLLGYSIQTEKDFEIIIADDGSTSKTKDVIDSFRSQFLNEIIHVWQEDEGFRKCKILNKAIEKSRFPFFQPFFYCQFIHFSHLHCDLQQHCRYLRPQPELKDDNLSPTTTTTIAATMRTG